VRLREMISTADWGGTPLLRQQVFERLNTGGVRLSQQEIRNSIYHGNFNSLLLELVKHPAFRTAWGIPVYTADEDSNPSDELLNIPMYAQMRDVEIVLRFFALRHAEHYKWGMAGFLDLYMVRTRKFTDEDIHGLNQLFIRTIELAHRVYGELLFRPWDSDRKAWSPRPQVAFADAVMVGLSGHLDATEELAARADQVVKETQRLFESNPPGTFTGQKNTKKDVQQRIGLFYQMLTQVLA